MNMDAAPKIFKIKQRLQTISSGNTRFFSHLDNPKLTCCLDEFTYTTTEELSDILKKTKLKSCVLDPIPAKVLSSHIDVILPIVTDIVNSSLETSHVPSSFKKAALYPTLKKSVTDYEEFSNFRPISNLKFISKMTEKVVSLRLLHYLRSNGPEELYQSAYKQFHSCETALIRVQNDILREIDGNSGLILLLLDLSAAFDTVDHTILLQRMHSKFGIKGDALNWFRSYLSDRSQTVYVNGATSDSYDVFCGVPQGSVLGPILYLIYTSPIGDILRSHGMKFHLYADDTQIYVSFNSQSQPPSLNEQAAAHCPSPRTRHSIPRVKDPTRLRTRHHHHPRHHSRRRTAPQPQRTNTTGRTAPPSTRRLPNTARPTPRRAASGNRTTSRNRAGRSPSCSPMASRTPSTSMRPSTAWKPATAPAVGGTAA